MLIAAALISTVTALSVEQASSQSFFSNEWEKTSFYKGGFNSPLDLVNNVIDGVPIISLGEVSIDFDEEGSGDQVEITARGGMLNEKDKKYKIVAHANYAREIDPFYGKLDISLAFKGGSGSFKIEPVDYESINIFDEKTQRYKVGELQAVFRNKEQEKKNKGGVIIKLDKQQQEWVMDIGRKMVEKTL